MRAYLIYLTVLFAFACADSSPALGKADYILIEKSKRALTLFEGERKLKSYKVTLGGSPLGPKEREGDGKTPEGIYFIVLKKADSGYHRALKISYPNKIDLERATELGIKPGGDIMIHGIKNGFGWLGPLHRYVDWTKGCIAVTNGEIEEIWTAVEVGTKVEIVR